MGEHTAEIRGRLAEPAPRSAVPAAPAQLGRPFAGLRVADFTAN